MEFDGQTIKALIDPKSPVPFFPLLRIKVNNKPDDKKNYASNTEIKFRLAWASVDVTVGTETFNAFPFQSIKLPNQRDQEEPAMEMSVSNAGLGIEQAFLESVGEDEEWTCDLYVVRGNDTTKVVGRYEKYYIREDPVFNNTLAVISLSPKNFHRKNIGILKYRPNITRGIF